MTQGRETVREVFGSVSALSDLDLISREWNR